MMSDAYEQWNILEEESDTKLLKYVMKSNFIIITNSEMLSKFLDQRMNYNKQHYFGYRTTGLLSFGPKKEMAISKMVNALEKLPGSK